MYSYSQKVGYDMQTIPIYNRYGMPTGPTDWCICTYCTGGGGTTENGEWGRRMNSLETNTHFRCLVTEITGYKNEQTLTYILLKPSNEARPLSYKTKTTYFFQDQDQDRFFKHHQIINPRSQKTFS